MGSRNIKRLTPLVVFCLVAIAGSVVHVKLWTIKQKSIKQQDIYFIFLEGEKLIGGVNPYENILTGDMRRNKKYATYFPLFYVMSGCVQLAGLHNFSEWLIFWRVVFLGCVIGIAYLIFQICAVNGQALLGIYGALFWLFNRWTLHVTVIGHIDFLPLLLLLLSLYFLTRRPFLAGGFFGLSLAIKQMAVIVLPVYLIFSWSTRREKRAKRLLATLALVAAIPILVSIPFLFWSSAGYFKSILFSATRYPQSHFGAPSLDALFGYYGIPAKIPMLFLLGLAYLLVLSRRVPLYASHLLVMAVFFCFNSVLFRQYTIWLMPFIPLTILEAICLGRTASPQTDPGSVSGKSFFTKANTGSRPPFR